ncbi:MAG: tyrosine-protein phosphatase, partial [Phycisphaerales bacterium]|nr:tyrosine-protein phosphatase [Phycisphaerales bacterium]
AIHESANEGQQVLVHCAAGAYRTGVAVVFYRLLVEGVDPSTMRAELKAYGWRDKDGDRLMPYLQENMNEMARKLYEAGVIEVIPDPVPMVPGA